MTKQFSFICDDPDNDVEIDMLGVECMVCATIDSLMSGSVKSLEQDRDTPCYVKVTTEDSSTENLKYSETVACSNNACCNDAPRRMSLREYRIVRHLSLWAAVAVASRVLSDVQGNYSKASYHVMDTSLQKSTIDTIQVIEMNEKIRDNFNKLEATISRIEYGLVPPFKDEE